MRVCQREKYTRIIMVSVIEGGEERIWPRLSMNIEYRPCSFKNRTIVHHLLQPHVESNIFIYLFIQWKTKSRNFKDSVHVFRMIWNIAVKLKQACESI